MKRMKKCTNLFFSICSGLCRFWAHLFRRMCKWERFYVQDWDENSSEKRKIIMKYNVHQNHPLSSWELSNIPVLLRWKGWLQLSEGWWCDVFSLVYESFYIQPKIVHNINSSRANERTLRKIVSAEPGVAWLQRKPEELYLDVIIFFT